MPPDPVQTSADDIFLAALRRHLGDQRHRAVDGPPDVPFVELGFDSMTTIQLILDVEELLGVVIPEECLTEDALRTPHALAATLAEVLGRESTA